MIKAFDTKAENAEIHVIHTPPFIVQLEYYRASGKYYSSGSYETLRFHVWEIFEEVRDMLHRGEWPGLCDGEHDFYVVVSLPDHPHGHSRLFIPGRTKYDN